MVKEENGWKMGFYQVYLVSKIPWLAEMEGAS